MARDSKLVFKFTRDVSAAVGTGGLRVDNLAGTASTTSTAVFVYANAAGTNYLFNRAASNALNVGGFRTTLGDAASFAAQADTSAITSDPALVGVTSMHEAYVRVTASLAGVAPTSTVPMYLQVEAASDSGTGTAGSNWIPVSAAAPMETKTAVRSITTGTITSGVVTSATLLSVGDVVVFTSQTGGTSVPVLQKPYYVIAATATTFTISSSLNGSVDSAVTGVTAFTATATPAQKHIISLPVAPTSRPWLRVAVVSTSTGATALAASQGVWIQDAFYTVGRDTAAIAS